MAHSNIQHPHSYIPIIQKCTSLPTTGLVYQMGLVSPDFLPKTGRHYAMSLMLKILRDILTPCALVYFYRIWQSVNAFVPLRY